MNRRTWLIAAVLALALILEVSLLVPAHAQLGPNVPEPNEDDAVSVPVTIHKPADPDQPQTAACAGCRAGAWWLCLTCSIQHVFNMGDLP